MISDPPYSGTAKDPSFLTKNALWLGPLLVCTGFISYFIIFSHYPVLRDFPWLNLPWVVLGFAITIWGFVKSARRRVGFLKTLIHVASLCFSLAITVLFVGYIFQISYLLPIAPTVSSTFKFPENLVLKDQTGVDVRLSNFQGKKRIMVFYRGFW